MPGTEDPINDPARLDALRDADLLDTPAEEAFDQLTRLAARLVEAPMALVSLVDRDRQFFKSAVGVDDVLAEARGTPIEKSFCRFAVEAQTPLVVPDAREDPRLRDNAVIREHGVVAYLGVPLVTDQGHALGTLCVIDSQPRAWSTRDVETVGALARTVMSTIALRASARAATRTAAPPDAPDATDRSEGLSAIARLHGAAAAYLEALERYEKLVRGAAGSGAQLAEEEGGRRHVAETFVALERALAACDPPAPGGSSAANGGDAGESARRVVEAARSYVRAERDREAASEAFLERRIGLDDFQIACAAVRAPEQALRQALIAVGRDE